eukprot:TRINITY_DN48640_c0_g1_i1.p2 TRINITY_DN48640_c0_g1~~TRINITY_DN48640_c0_g1_i1.p2  ORF type:complete len:160 (+),score=63.12 TRINITY_DN48640_c0_g1_i1:60-482(+)
MPRRLEAVAAVRDDGFQMGDVTDQEIARELLHPANLEGKASVVPFKCVSPPEWAFPHALPSVEKERVRYLQDTSLIHVTGTYMLKSRQQLRIQQGQILQKHIAMRALGLIAPNCPNIPVSDCNAKYPDLQKNVTLKIRVA